MPIYATERYRFLAKMGMGKDVLGPLPLLKFHKMSTLLLTKNLYPTCPTTFTLLLCFLNLSSILFGTTIRYCTLFIQLSQEDNNKYRTISSCDSYQMPRYYYNFKIYYFVCLLVVEVG